MRLMAATRAAVVLAATALVGGCSSPLGPPNASKLLHRIPDCSQFVTNTPDVLAQQDVSCTTADGTIVDVATFASTDSERHWIQKQGVWGACCLQGRLWAATVDSSNIPSEPDWQHVQQYLGGRQVDNLG